MCSLVASNESISLVVSATIKSTLVVFAQLATCLLGLCFNCSINCLAVDSVCGPSIRCIFSSKPKTLVYLCLVHIVASLALPTDRSTNDLNLLPAVPMYNKNSLTLLIYL